MIVNSASNIQSNIKKANKTGMCINEKRGGELDGTETVAKVLNTHINNNSVCKWGSRALCNIIF